jgi:CDP-diglyceride synthetase
MKLPFKFDKNLWMNFLHSFLGGILGGIVIAFSLGQSPSKRTLFDYFILLLFILFLALFGILIMAYLNYRFGQKRIS